MKIDFDHIPPDLAARKETRALKGAIVYLRRYKETHAPGRNLARKLTRTIRRLMRQLIGAEKFNYAVKTKWEMLHDPAWRERVTEDLGGEPALTRWEVQKSKADSTLFDPPLRDPKQVERDMAKTYLEGPDKMAAARPASLKTDREGLFRLAPIKRRYRPLTIKEQWAREEVKAWQQAFKTGKKNNDRTNITDTFKPIPVTPSELRGHATKRTGGLTWEQLKQMDAAEAEAERLWFEQLINAPEPDLVLVKHDHTQYRSSSRDQRKSLAGKRGPHSPAPNAAGDSRFRGKERNENIRGSP